MYSWNGSCDAGDLSVAAVDWRLAAGLGAPQPARVAWCHRRSLLAIASVLSALPAMAPLLLLAGPPARPSPRHHPDMLGRPVVVQA